jgi:homospermidine synthase
MNFSSLAGVSGNFLQSSLQKELTSNTLSSSSHSAKTKQSEFAQLLNDAGVKPAATSANASQMLSQMVNNFQASGIQSQGQSLDPISIGS